MKIDRLPQESWIIDKNSLNLLLGFITTAKDNAIYWDRESKRNNYCKKYEDSYIKYQARYNALLFVYNWIEGKQLHNQKGKTNETND